MECQPFEGGEHPYELHVNYSSDTDSCRHAVTCVCVWGGGGGVLCWVSGCQCRNLAFYVGPCIRISFSLSSSPCAVLLANSVNPDNLYGNVVKITDFGLAREIVDTTNMSGAGTYPWMAPEVIRSHEFSKKSDVWR